MQYRTVQNVSKGPDVTLYWGGTCKTQHTYAMPNPGNGVIRSYEPKTVVHYRTPKEPSSVSFKKIRQSGEIKMTDYVNSKREIRRSLVRVKRELVDIKWPHCPDLNWVGNQVKFVTPYEEVGDQKYWSDKYQQFGGVSLTEHGDAVEAVKTAVVAANVNTYDLLTELGEAKETLAMVISILRAVRRPLEAYKAFERQLRKNKKLSKEKMYEALQSKWMEYRYAIMPAFYSIQDISKLVKERNNAFKTDREKRVITYNNVTDVPLVNPHRNYVYQVMTGTTIVRATGKARYNLSNLNLRLFDQIGLNPFVTAWELIPFSFVVDWFVNIGDWVQAQTSSLVDLAEQRSFCYSVKHDIRVVTKLRVNEVEKFTRTFEALKVSVIHENPIDVDEVLATEVISHYERHIFHAGDTKIVSDAFLNWKRGLDAFVLSNKPLIKALRSLK